MNDRERVKQALAYVQKAAELLRGLDRKLSPKPAYRQRTATQPG